MERRGGSPWWSEGGASGWAAFEWFSAATHVFSDGGLIVEANPAFELMFGGPRSAFRGRRLEDLCAGPCPTRRRLASRILHEASDRGAWEGRIESRGHDGRRFTTRAHVFSTRVDGRRYFVCIQEETGTPPARGGFNREAPHARNFAASV